MAKVIETNSVKAVITGITRDSEFHDVDLSSYIPAGATGVIIEIIASQPNSYTLPQIRKKGSTDNISFTNNTTIGQRSYQVYCGVDGNRTLQIKSNYAEDVFFVSGWFNAGSVFFDNAVNKTSASTGTWDDTDISTQLGADAGNVAAAIIFVSGTPKNTFGLRNNGSTEGEAEFSTMYGQAGFIIGIDANDVFEQYRGDADHTVYLIGYIKKGFGLTMFTDAVKHTVTFEATGWLDLDLSADIPSGGVNFVGRLRIGGSGWDFMMRQHGSIDVAYMDTSITNTGFVVGVDGSRLTEVYRSDSSYPSASYIYTLGYIEDVSPVTEVVSPFVSFKQI